MAPWTTGTYYTILLPFYQTLANKALATIEATVFRERDTVSGLICD